MNFSTGLRITKPPVIAFVGAGGKTTGMFQLARELKGPVIVTATTHLAVEQTSLADKHFAVEKPNELESVIKELNGVVLVTGPITNNKTGPIDESDLLWLREYRRQADIPLLIEADGSRNRPLKAPAGHEPPIPGFVDMVVQVVGMNGIGKPLTEENVHRPEIFARLSGSNIGDEVTPEGLAQVLLHTNGGLKNIPTRARRVALLNQADSFESQGMAGKLAKQLLSGYESILVASLKQKEVFAVHEKVAGIVLAAGGSQRFGSAKQLLDWHGQPFVRAVAKTALSAGLSPVLVVTGSDAQEVEAAVNDLPVEIVRNEEWQEGQAASIRAAVLSLSPPADAESIMGQVGAAIFLLVDQPQVTTSILSALIEGHSATLPPILVPLVMDQRANPVLFDRVTFGDLLELKGDTGGRAIFSKYPVKYLPWHDDRLLLDVDTPEQYTRLISDNTL